MSILDRKPRTKKWSTIYTEKIEQNNNKNRRKLDSRPSMDKLSTLWAKTLLAKKMVKKIRAKLQAKEFTCKKTLDNIHPPEPLGEWKSHWGSQTMCNICETPAIFDCIVCKTCDVVVHISCVEQMDIDKRYRIQSIKKKDSDDITLELRCAECAEHAKAEVDYYHREREKLIKDRERMLLARKIAKRMITYTIRQRFKRQRAVTILVQSLIRKHMIRKKFGQWRRNQIRVVSIELVQAPKVDNGLIVWTIVDTFKNIQLFRLDKQLNKSEDGFLIPGASGNVSLFVTLIAANMTMVAQARLSFRDIDPYVSNQEFSLVFSDNILWIPQESRNDKMIFHMPQPSTIAEKDPEPKKCVIRYTSFSSITSMCLETHGPPLDVLRRPAYAFANNPKAAGAVQERKSKWWLCVVEGHLLFYQYYGDTRPRFIASIADATAIASREQQNSVVLLFGDRRKWVFDFDDVGQANRFVFTVTETRKAMEGTSYYFKKMKATSLRLY